LWHSVNFLVLVGVLWFLFFRPFGRVVAQRQKHIQESLARADEIARLDSQAVTERDSLIAEAHREASEIRRRAHDQASRYVRRSRARANADANRIREQAADRHSPPRSVAPHRARVVPTQPDGGKQRV
jgi:F-type H+-transporting ATPase subunit b